MVMTDMKLKDTFSLEKNYDKPRNHIQKQRHHFVDKIHIDKAMVFSVVMYECKSCIIKKTEHQRIDTFKL